MSQIVWSLSLLETLMVSINLVFIDLSMLIKMNIELLLATLMI
uniref:Uncharacterized protein n=1 Tax=CrAss-like virus sp. ctYsL76 TaxID=2826826 RepID=A0A8S5QLM9_9CAUD|nr:MAG TPA: hypothetical protein [CrAss-like virus sp. ctYsL76]